MGVNGLLRLLQPISVPRQIGHFQGQTLGVDGYAWLHRAAASCADELVRNTDTTRLVQSIDKRIRLYESAGVNLYFVFDGAHIDMKARVSAQRHKAREQAKAAYLMNQSQNVMGGVSITPDHAAMVVAYLKARGIRFVVAPYEADSQLVWLEKNGHVDGILSEDGDLLVFGATRLLTKADGRTGDCVEVCAASLPPHLDAAGLRALAVIAGCDYSQGVAGLGPIKTSALVKTYAGDLLAICASLLRSNRIDEHFVDEARRAELAFQFQRVWDPRTCNIVHLNDPREAGVDAALLLDTVIGPLLPRPDAHRIARCVVDPNNPQRALPVSPAVSHFVARLPPVALATPSKYASPAAVRSMVERRLPMTPTNCGQVSPFFRQKPVTPAPRDTTDANKENTCMLPTPPPSISAATTASGAGPGATKRASDDTPDAASRLKALRTDTVVDAATPTRAAAPASRSFRAPSIPPSAAVPALASMRRTTQSTIESRSGFFSIVRSDSVSAAESNGDGAPRSAADEEPSVVQKLASLRQFAYTKS